MHPARGFRLPGLACLAAAFAATAAVAFAVSPAGAAELGPSGTVLSPRLAELATPAVRDAPPAEQARELDVAAAGPGSLLRDGDRVLVSVRFDHGAIAGLPALRAAGGRVLDSSRGYQSATVAVDPADLIALADVPGVASVTENRAPLLFSVGEPPCEGGSTISEGLGHLRVDEAREGFSLRGKGVTIGVLSDSFDVATEAADESGPVATHAHQDVVSDDLPGPAGTCSGQQLPVDVLEEGTAAASADEGRAMLQIVHDLAPNASLAFATAFQSEESFAQNIELLAKPVSEGGAGADVIVDDVAWFEEPFFQDGPVAAAINEVTATGVVYLTAAGNDNLFNGEGDEIASWEAPEYRDSAGCPAVVEGLAGFHGTHCMDFQPGAGTDRTFGITVQAHATLTVDLQWAEPWNGVATDLDAFLLGSGEQLLRASFDDNSGKTGTQRPVEILQWPNESSSAQTVQLALNRFSGVDPRLKFILLENGSGVTATEYPESSGEDVVGPTVFGHAGDPSATTLGAIRYNGTQPEVYSSRGPVTHYFEPVEKGISPAAALGSPQTIAKPDLAATDCGATTFFAHVTGGVWRFCGTSAAAPHAAGVAALLRQGKPGATPAEIQAAMTGSASPVAASPNTVGAGLVDADGAMALFGIVPSDEDPPATVVPPLEGDSEEGATPQAPPAPVPPLVASATSRSEKRLPGTFFRRHPPHLILISGRWATAVFRFGATSDGVGFNCRVDDGPVRACPERFVHRYAVGAHVLRAMARDAERRVDPTPAVFRFSVGRRG